VQRNEIALPSDWSKGELQLLVKRTPEDPRKRGLKHGLRQLNELQLERVIHFEGEMVLDTHNYEDGKFCPLGIALGLDKIITEPTHDKVYDMLLKLGYRVYNTRGIEGNFYTTNRKEDLIIAAKEVLAEKHHG
jgi:hypothetical protein